MKKQKLLLICAFLLCLIISGPVLRVEGATPRLIDSANLLTAAEETMLLDRLDSVSETYQVDVVVALVPTTDGYPADLYIEYFYDENGYGYGTDRDGVILLVAMAEREYRILSNGFGAQAISTDDIDFIGDMVASSLTSGDYVDAVLTFADECAYEIDGEIYGFPFDFGGTAVFSLIAGLVTALIATGCMKAKLKSVRRQTMATEYTKRDSMQITNSNEYFLYRTVNRQKKENSSTGSSRSSGPSRNIGGGRF